ncbi:hypothetical protein [Burkholderia cepacia]|uniref:hypothetical protein n=1 Tax=Burkholderia cepacia TaxID=292 RepID=UPI002651C58E|nr:hypothetical protein [Burkholderia cepacia]MDN7913702.1 hypothetical protein [Burkholderia cepacia]
MKRFAAACVALAIVLGVVRALDTPRLKLFETVNGASCVAVIGTFGSVALSCDWNGDGAAPGVKTRWVRS